MTFRIVRWLFLFSPLAAVAAAPTAAELAELFAPSQVRQPVLSPDGAYLGFIVRQDDRYAVAIYSFATRKMNYMGDKTTIPTNIWWKGPQSLLVRTTTYQYDAKDYLLLDATTNKPKDMWRLSNQDGLVFDAQPQDPDHVLMLQRGDIARVDISSGRSQTVTQQVARSREWVVDGLGRARSTIEYHGKFGEVDVWWRPGPSGPWRSHTYAEKDDHFYPSAVMADERYVVGWQITPDLDLSVARLDTASGTVEVVSRMPDRDPTGILILGRTRIPIAVTYQQGGAEKLVPLAASDEPAIGRLEKHFAGYQVRILDAMPDGRNWLLRVESSQLPGAYILFNHETSAASVIATSHDQALTEDKLAPAEYFRFPSRHGDALSAMMWRPKDKPNAPLIVICPQSLPALAVEDSFQPRIQAWVRLGFAVVRVNPHNSWGFGKAGRQPGPDRWIPALQEDLEDAAQFLASKKAADPSRLFLFGDDFGGVLALQVVARSKVFAAVGTINIPRELHRDDLHQLTYEPGSNPLATKLGGWREGEKFAQDLSPLAVVRHLAIPAVYLSDEDSIKGWPKQDGRAIRDAVKNAKTTAETGLAYSWTQYPMLPTQRAREGAEIAIKIAKFFEAHPAAPAK